jgi:hypothetical protein
MGQNDYGGEKCCLPAKCDLRPAVQGSGQEAKLYQVLDNLGRRGLAGKDLGEDVVSASQVCET